MAIEDQLREYLRRAAGDLADARRQISELEGAGGEPIAVIGMACRFPSAPTVEDYWDLLSNGRSGVSEIPLSRWDADEYYDPERRTVGGIYTRSGAFLDEITEWDADFFGVSPGEALRMDPHQRLMMELTWEGMEDAGTSPTELAGTRTAVMVGLMNTVQYGRLQLDLYGPQIAADPQFGAGVSGAVASGRLAYHFDLRGPTMTIDTACSSSLVATHLAIKALRHGECDFAVVAGAFLHMTPDTYVNPCAASML
jgi:acyl transferase domain-containing protein